MSLQYPATVSQITRKKEESRDELPEFGEVLRSSGGNQIEYRPQSYQAMTIYEHPQSNPELQPPYMPKEYANQHSWDDWNNGSSVAVNTRAAGSASLSQTATEDGVNIKGRVTRVAKMINMSNEPTDDDKRSHPEDKASKRPIQLLQAYVPRAETDRTEADAIDPTLLYDLSVQDQHEVIFGGASEAAYTKVNAILQQNRKDASSVAATS